MRLNRPSSAEHSGMFVVKTSPADSAADWSGSRFTCNIGKFKNRVSVVSSLQETGVKNRKCVRVNAPHTVSTLDPEEMNE